MNNKQEKKLKIAQVVCMLPPQAGGLGMVAHSYAEQLAKRGHEVTVLLPKAGVDFGDRQYKIKKLIPWLRSGLGAVMPQLIWRLWKYDIVHYHHPLFGSAFFVCLLKRLKKDKIKLVVSYHQDVHLKGWKGVYEKITRRIFLKQLLKMADKIIVSSFDYIEASNVQKYYFQNLGKFVELPFGAPRRFNPKEKNIALLKKYGFDQDDKIVMFLGGLGQNHYFKGVNFLIKAISLIDDKKVKALIVGRGRLKKDYQKMANDLKVNDRVIFTGYIPDKVKVDYYNLSDMFILPSINSSEAFGIVLVEAMACGKPVLASNLKGVRAVVDPGINGLLMEPGNSRDIANKIGYLVANPKKIKLFGSTGAKTVEKKYRWSVIIDQLEKIYIDLC
ncbi:MAG TPA: glycosyltransferase family 4 protein [Patescibacteria group bacterium]|nr:glycosyltransferase family 4 protein [Patescibacteria group bacterium]